MENVNNFQYTKATIFGVGLLIIGHLLYIGVLQKIEHQDILRKCVLCIPFMSGMLAAYLAPGWKILVGASMGFWGAIIGIASATFYRYLGFKTDSIGTTLETFTVIFIYQTFLGLLGGIVIKAIQSKK